jgi:hypothetical protein
MVLFLFWPFLLFLFPFISFVPLSSSLLSPYSFPISKRFLIVAALVKHTTLPSSVFTENFYVSVNATKYGQRKQTLNIKLCFRYNWNLFLTPAIFCFFPIPLNNSMLCVDHYCLFSFPPGYASFNGVPCWAVSKTTMSTVVGRSIPQKYDSWWNADDQCTVGDYNYNTIGLQGVIYYVENRHVWTW